MVLLLEKSFVVAVAVAVAVAVVGFLAVVVDSVADCYQEWIVLWILCL